MMAHLALYLFGPPRVELNNKLLAFDRRKAIALLAYLAITGEAHSRDALAALLWPDLDQQRARAALRRTLTALNKATIGDWLESNRQVIGFNNDESVWVDVHQFQKLIKGCLANDDSPCEDCQPHLAEAVTLYRDDFLAGFTLRDSPDFDEWQFFQAEQLRRDLANTLTYLVRCYQSQQAFGQAIHYAQRALALDPTSEPVHRQLMTLYAHANQPAAAIHQYQECVRLLKENLGLEPSPETVALYKAVQNQPERNPAPLPPPEMATLYNFPAQSTPFIGRRIELEEIAARLQNPGCRLLTLVGPGGIGKTRLVIQTALSYQDSFRDGIYFVPLAAVSSPDFLVAAIADSLGLTLDGRESPRPQLLNYLKNRRMLLVLDNFEHLVKKVDLLADILLQASRVTVLVTSRERMNIQGEWTFEIKGLPYPQADQVGQMEGYHAVALFLQSAHRIHSSFALSEEDKPHIIRICRLVEGMPLAIELAAAWVRLLSCREIADEIERMVNLQQSLDFLTTSLHDVPTRHRSLQAVFDHSWQLLTPEEQSTFKRLSVFRGGCHREAIEWVAEASLADLSALVDKSLLTRSQAGRYEMHELLKQFAVEKLRQTPDEADAVQARHCEFYATFLEQREEAMKGARQEEILAEISEEIENVRASWRWAVMKHNSREIARTVKSLGRFYSMYSRFKEGLDAFENALIVLRGRETGEQATLIGQLLAYQGWFLLRQGHYDQARIRLHQSIAIFTHLEDEANLAMPLQFMGILAGEVGDYEEGQQRLQESLNIFRRLGDEWEVAWTLSHLGYCLSKLEGGERTEARQILQESLEIYQNIGGKQGISIGLSNLGYVIYRLGDQAEAKQLLQESLTLRREIGYPRGIAVTLNNLGHVAGASGEFEVCKAYYFESLKIAQGIGAIPLALGALGGLAVPLVNEGRKTLACDLLALVLHHPASNKETRNRAMRFLNDAWETLTATMADKAKIPIPDYEREFERLVSQVLEEKPSI